MRRRRRILLPRGQIVRMRMIWTLRQSARRDKSANVGAFQVSSNVSAPKHLNCMAAGEANRATSHDLTAHGGTNAATSRHLVLTSTDAKVLKATQCRFWGLADGEGRERVGPAAQSLCHVKSDTVSEMRRMRRIWVGVRLAQIMRRRMI